MPIDVINNSHDRLSNALNFYHAVPDNCRNRADVRDYMNSCLAEVYKSLEKCCAEAPLTADDIQALQIFRDELNSLDTQISKLSTGKLKQKIDKLVLTGPDKAVFEAKATLKDKIRFLLDRFKDVFVGMIRQQIRKQMFFTWNQKQRFNQTLKDVVKLSEEIAKLQAKLAQSPNNAKLEGRLQEKQRLLEQKETFLREYEGQLAAGTQTRRDLLSVGGTRVAIETKDHVQLDGIYLSAHKFNEACEKAHARPSNLAFSLEAEEQQEIQGLVLDVNDENAVEFLNTLSRLKVFKDFSGTAEDGGSGWVKINAREHIYIVPDFELQTLIDQGAVEVDGGLYVVSEEAAVAESQLPAADIDPQKSGTIILGLGAGGLYEMYKREAMALLMQGVNVMLYNPRGHGESAGTPTELGTYEDIEAVYQYLKQTHHVEDEKLVVRGLCLSGGMAAHLASNHPQINLILDQTYADITDVSLKTVMDGIKELINYTPENTNVVKNAVLMGLNPIMKSLVKAFSPGYSTVRHLQTMQGKLLVMRALDDKYMPKELSDKIVDTYASNATYEKMSSQMRVGHMHGDHGDSWLDANANDVNQTRYHLGRYHMLTYLRELDMLNPLLDIDSTVENLSEGYTDYLENIAPLENTETVDGRQRYAEVLADLDRLKDRLGGSLGFPDGPPVMDIQDNQRTFLGFPIAHVQDYLRGAMNDHRRPAFFWRQAGRLFDVNGDNALSPYEDVHLRIQRFGMLAANKQKLIKILNEANTEQYNQFNYLTGMAWHINDNGPDAEKSYFEIIEHFLTTFYEQAKAEGDDALIAYFRAISGACFEDRVRNLIGYIQTHNIKDADVQQALQGAGWHSTQAVELAFNEEARVLTAELGRELPTPAQMLARLREKGIFETEFAIGDQMAAPTIKQFHTWAMSMIDDAWTLDPYPPEELIAMEMAVMREDGLPVDEASVMAQLRTLAGQNQEEFDPEAPETLETVRRLLQEAV